MSRHQHPRYLTESKFYFLPKELCKKVGNCTFLHSVDTEFDRACVLCCSYAVLLRIPLSGLRRDLRPFLWLEVVMCGSGTRQVTRFPLVHGGLQLYYETLKVVLSCPAHDRLPCAVPFHCVDALRSLSARDVEREVEWIHTEAVTPPCVVGSTPMART